MRARRGRERHVRRRGGAVPDGRPTLRPAPRRYAFGECYYEVSKDRADELLEEQKDKVQEEIDGLKVELSKVVDTLADLKEVKKHTRNHNPGLGAVLDGTVTFAAMQDPGEYEPRRPSRSLPSSAAAATRSRRSRRARSRTTRSACRTSRRTLREMPPRAPTRPCTGRLV